MHWSAKSGTWVYGGAKRVKINPKAPTDPPPNNSLVVEGNSDSEDDAGKRMQWCSKYGAWVYAEAKRVRKKDLTNKMEKNWVLGMRRNWNTDKKDKMLEKITIKRNKTETVKTHPCPSNMDETVFVSPQLTLFVTLGIP